MLRKLLVLMAVAAASISSTVLTAPGQASATTVSTAVCTETETLNFSPPLSLNNNLGTVNVTLNYSCVPASVSTAPAVNVGPPFGFSGIQYTMTYQGTCALATINEGTFAFIVGGILQVQVTPSGAVQRTMVLTPNSGSSQCNLASASGVGETNYPIGIS